MEPLVALVATAPMGSGRVVIDKGLALALPGTRCVVDHTNAPRLRKAVVPSFCEPGTRMPLQSDRIDYAGQAVAIVVADGLQAARDALAALVITVEGGSPPTVTLEDGADRLSPVKRAGIGPGVLTKGDADAALATATHRVEVEAHAAPHHPNPLEPGSVIARWDEDGGVTVHAAVQWHHIDSAMIGQAFGLGWSEGLAGLLGRAVLGRRGRGKVRLHNHLSGGAFGRNISYQALILAPMAAKVAGAPVRLVQTRRDTFSLMSHRSEVAQRLGLGADADGKLEAIVLEPDIARGHAAFVEPVGEMPMQVYAHRTHRLTTRVAPLDLPGAGWMRGPGVAHAIFALEQGVDALARRTGIDPLDLRLANHADRHPVSGKPWEAKALRDAYEEGAERFGWRERAPGGSLREDGRLRGFGMASAIDLGRQFPAHAHVTLTSDARVIVSLAVAEMGQGLLTGLTGLVSEMTGVPPDRVVLTRDATAEGYAAGSIGSTGTYSNGAAIEAAVTKLRARLAKVATRKGGPLAGAAPNALTLSDGTLAA
ncbi:MAG: xanthine dehydrogenase family protein, partial [Pseudomonadota bacterium]